MVYFIFLIESQSTQFIHSLGPGKYWQILPSHRHI